MDHKNEVEVVIGGEIIKLVAPESEVYMQRVASYINKKIMDIYKIKSGASTTGYLKNLFITINIADDYLKEQEKNEQLTKEIEAYFAQFTMLESENHVLKQRIKQLEASIVAQQEELVQTKETLLKVQTEFDAYIENFDQEQSSKRN